MPRKMIAARKQSIPARCVREVGHAVDAEGVVRVFQCGAPMQLIIKEPKVWSYQERVAERCDCGHIAHAQAVVPEPERCEPPIDDDADCWGAF